MLDYYPQTFLEFSSQAEHRLELYLQRTLLLFLASTNFMQLQRRSNDIKMHSKTVF